MKNSRSSFSSVSPVGGCSALRCWPSAGAAAMKSMAATRMSLSRTCIGDLLAGFRRRQYVRLELEAGLERALIAARVVARHDRDVDGRYDARQRADRGQEATEFVVAAEGRNLVGLERVVGAFLLA